MGGNYFQLAPPSYILLFENDSDALKNCWNIYGYGIDKVFCDIFQDNEDFGHFFAEVLSKFFTGHKT